MPQYKLTYFNITALGEPIRWLLSYMNQKFEDVRIDLTGDQWSSIKKNFPLGQMPTLEIDGKVAHQHLAICRYLGKECGLAGDNGWEGMQIDAVADTTNDFRLKMYQTYWEPDETKKEENFKAASTTTLPFYMEKFNEMAASGYLANNKLSWADLHFVSLMDYFNLLARYDIAEKHPNLKKLRDNVLSIPQIREWIAKRPKTQF